MHIILRSKGWFFLCIFQRQTAQAKTDLTWRMEVVKIIFSYHYIVLFQVDKNNNLQWMKKHVRTIEKCTLMVTLSPTLLV